MLSRRQFIASTALGLTPLALSAASGKQSVRLALGESYRPLGYEEAGVMRGLIVDILQAVFGKMDVELNITIYPWARAQALVRDGKEDALCAVASPARLEYASSSREPVLIMPTHPFVSLASPLRAALLQSGSLDDIGKLNPSVLANLGNGWVKEKLGAWKVDVAGDVTTVARKLASGRGDVAFMNSITMQQALKEQGITDRVAMLPFAVDNEPAHLLISHRSPARSILPRFDQHMAAFRRDPAYRMLLQRYGVMA